MRYILAIDQGTSGTKALVFDEHGEAIARGSAPLSATTPRPGFVEQDPEAIWTSVLQAVASCLAAFTGDRDAIAGVGISNQRETALLWDKNTGVPLCPAIVWQCRRSVEICERLAADGAGPMIAERTGLLIDPYFSGTKLVWMNENDAIVRRAIATGTARFGTVDTWLLHRMTQGQHYRTDYTNASRTMLFNYRTLRWDADILRRFGLENLELPELLPSASLFGETNFDGLLPRAVPVAAMIGDSHAAAFGEGCFAPGIAKATMGTGSSIMMNAGSQPRLPDKGLVSTVCFSLPGRVDYALEGIIVSCGSTASWLKDKMGLFADFAEAERLCATTDNGGVYLIPAFAGLGCPHWKLDARAQIVGLTFASTRDHVIRAAYESIAYQIKDVIAVMEQTAGVPLTDLYLDGGLSQKPFLSQFLADVLNRPVATLESTDISASGAAHAALYGLGIVTDLDQLKGARRIARRTEPGAGAAQAADLYGQWQRWIEKI